MNNKSLDGLKLKVDKSTPKLVVRKATKPASKTSAATPTPTKKRTEIAVHDFLSSIQDNDPTDLVGLPPEQTEEQVQLTPRERKKVAKHTQKLATWDDNETTVKPQKRHRIRRIILIIVGSLLLLAIGAGVWLWIQGNDLISNITGGGSLTDILTSNPDTPLAKDPKSGRTNVLIFGTEGESMDNPNYAGGWLTDSMMVASINQETGDIKTVSLPRDLKSNTCTSTSKLNEVYYCTYSKNDGSTASRKSYETQAAKALAAEAEKILGIKIQYQIHVNWAALIKIVNAIGGIDVVFTYGNEKWNGPQVSIEVTDPRGLADWSTSCQCYNINYETMKVIHLSGWNALAVARARNASGGWGAAGGNFNREIFQQKIIQATIEKIQRTNFLTDIGAALEIQSAIGDNIRMSFQAKEFKTLFRIAGEINMNAMQSISLINPDDHAPLLTTSCDASNGISYVCPVAGLTNYTDIHDYVARKLSSDPENIENAKISVLNATSISGLAAKESDILTDEGYNVTETTNAPDALAETEGVAIYQRSKSMSATAKALAKLYNVKITTDIPASLKTNTADFIIVIGSGYNQ